ncbi:hypothetical protein, partial [uncultured Duncaniella sp.]|uniref:hypothetical protein n=1 Tax=uncultured Duncaniella sp. TaxID=2768039 RepID=UPI0025AA01EF
KLFVVVYLFFFFSILQIEQESKKDRLFCSLFCLHRKTFESRPVRDVRSLYLLRLSVELTESFVFLLTLVLLSMSIVILSMCSVLSSRLPHQAFSGKTLQR